MTFDDPSPGGPPSNSSSSPYAQFYPITIRPELMVRPDPLILWYTFLGPTGWQTAAQNSIIKTLELQQKNVGRRLTQDETDVIVETATGHLYHKSIGQPAGILIAVGSCCYNATQSADWAKYVRTKDEIPTPRELSQAMRNFATVNPRGCMIAVARGVFQVTMGALVGQWLMGSISALSDFGRVLKDKRMKGFWEDMNRKKAERTGRGSPSPSSSLPSVVVPREEVHGEGEGEGQGQEHDNGFGGSGSDEEALRFGASTTATMWGQQKEEARRPVQAPLVASQDNKGGSFWDDDEDASPVAAEYRDDLRPGESAWDRIRRQNNLGGSQQGQGQGQNVGFRPVQSGSNAVFGSGRNVEREQAQADFDRMLDQERKMSTDAFQGSQQKNGGWWGKWD
ncbi:hypothetical protein BO78DRAFT_398820 [Aspergillus sclerotiicarbonarius CBS 121057]|uniref:Uncharacterized protein n=1 Tax=Aspergillus sclerotiicarbonarius (strain CBS 121057 / IBT 28362) TaxID=1448318 RepID=A0A319EDD6_ASPSB|nr:hypothetical protein BO78DRAFT_398820 [Aspergillus sclerotiicarbonarius CBS 121057]